MQRDMNGNPSIKCSVSSCAYHSGTAGMCTLGEITVGHTQQNVVKADGTECASFQLGDHGSNCGCR